MNKIKNFLVCVIVILIFAIILGCQTTPKKHAVVGQDTDKLESKLSAKPLAPNVYEVPKEVEDDVKLNTCTFHIKAAVEVSDSQTHPVYTLQRRDFSKSDIENIGNTLIPGIVGMRDGSKETKEEIEKEILILKQGIPTKNADGTITYAHNDQSDKVLSDYYEELKNAPEEIYTPVNGTVDYTPPVDEVFKLTNGNKARCRANEKSILMSPNEAGIVQKQSWLIRDGGWEGEGPVHLSPKLAAETAKQTGNDLLAKLKISNMQLASIEAARMIDDSGYDTLSTGWYLTYTFDKGDGVQFDSNSVSKSFMKFKDDATYAPYWPQEKVEVYMDESGVRFFTWVYPCSTVEEVNSNVVLLPFSDIYSRTKELIKQGFAWTDSPGKKNEDYYVNRVLLTNCLVRKKDDTKTAYWMPTWVFVYQQESRLDNSVTPGYIAVNAIDGSRVDMYGSGKPDKAS